jgi:hypothetical protein
MSPRNLEHRIGRLEKKLIGPPRPKCRVCGKEGGCAVRMEVHHYPSGEVRYGSRGESPAPCRGCQRINVMMGVPASLRVCEWYGRGEVGEVCPVCGTESLATLRQRIDKGELHPSQIPPMVQEVGRGRRRARRPLGRTDRG